MKRKLSISLILLCLALITITACNPMGGSSPTASPQPVKVTRGDLIVSVKGNGKIEAPSDIKLTFGSPGRIEKIYVQEGDAVAKDKVLARLDTASLELARSQAQVAIAQAQVALTQANLARQTAELDRDMTKDRKDILELALLNAQIATRTAQYNLDKARDVYRWPEVETAQADVDDAKSQVEYAAEKFSKAGPNDLAVWADYLARAQAALAAKQAKLDAQLKGYDTEEVAIKKMQLDASARSETQAQQSLDRFAKELAVKEQQISSARESADLVQRNIDLAKQSLADAEKKLKEATITAPFAGMVASVDADEGDTVSSVNKIIHLVDPANLEMRVEVDEIDVPEIEMDQETLLTFDALPGVTVKGKVTAILPVPKVEGGVVLYLAKVGFTVPPNVNIKVGMSASAEIITDRRNNVLLIPNRTISADGQGKPVVKVLVGEQTQERLVTLGISDGVQTEVLGGVGEGETLVVEARARSGQQAPGLF